MNFSSPRRQSNAKFSFFCFKIDRAGTENWDKNLRNCNFCLVLHGLRCAQQFSLPLWWINLTSRLWKLDCMERRKKKKTWMARHAWGGEGEDDWMKLKKKSLNMQNLKQFATFFGYNLNKINLLKIFFATILIKKFIFMEIDFTRLWSEKFRTWSFLKWDEKISCS